MVCATVASVMRHEALELKFVWLLYQLVQHFQYSRALQFWHQYTQYFGEGKSSIFKLCGATFFIFWGSIKTLSDTGIKTSCLHPELRHLSKNSGGICFREGQVKLLMYAYYVEVNFEVLFPIGHDLEKYSSSSPPRPHLKRGGLPGPSPPPHHYNLL